LFLFFHFKNAIRNYSGQIIDEAKLMLH